MSPKRPKPPQQPSRRGTASRGASAARGRSQRPRNRAGLKAPQLERLRRTLLDKRTELLEAYHTVRGESRSDLDSGTEDYMDYASHSYAKDFLLSLTEMERQQLRLVEEALARLDTPEFGLCLNCEKPIHPKRLDVVPWVRYCVSCQELEEKGLLVPPEAQEEEGEAPKKEVSGGDEEEELEAEEALEEELVEEDALEEEEDEGGDEEDEEEHADDFLEEGLPVEPEQED